MSQNRNPSRLPRMQILVIIATEGPVRTDDLSTVYPGHSFNIFILALEKGLTDSLLTFLILYEADSLLAGPFRRGLRDLVISYHLTSFIYILVYIAQLSLLSEHRTLTRITSDVC